MLKNIHIWLGSYVAGRVRRRFFEEKPAQPIHVMFCFVDHFEPDWNGASDDIQRRRVQEWVDRYPLIARRHTDADGHPPQHTFFYPAEVFDRAHVGDLSRLCQQGLGEIEIHLHHDGDTEATLREKLDKAKQDFCSMGLLGRDNKNGSTRFGFIHGNWALNNSRKDGKWCGVNNESDLLYRSGCYADFTLPSAPSETQTVKINSIYYDSGESSRPKSHDTGVDLEAGKRGLERLVLVQGPLTFNWKNRKAGVLPRIENSDITGVNPPTSDRVDLWVDQRISVKERPEWIFIKIHTHGAVEKNAETLLGAQTDTMHSYLESEYNDGERFVLHYVSAREMYNIIKAAEHGLDGNPHQYRDYRIVSNIKKNI